MSLTIRTLKLQDLAHADELRELAGWNQSRHFWHHLLQWNPSGCFLALNNGTPAGTAAVTPYNSSFAWIGMVLVHPDHRHQGIGTALLHQCLALLKERQIPCARLDATPQGAPLYQRLGFQVEHSLTRWQGTTHSTPTPHSLHPWNAAPSTSFRQLDQRAFGIQRQTRLNDLAAHSLQSVASLSPNHEVLGFGLLQPGAHAHYLGPIVAHSPRHGVPIAEKLLENPEPHPVLWDIPDQNQPAIHLATRLGFTPQRPLIRMIRGRTPALGNPLFQFAIADPAIG